MILCIQYEGKKKEPVESTVRPVILFQFLGNFLQTETQEPQSNCNRPPRPRGLTLGLQSVHEGEGAGTAVVRMRRSPWPGSGRSRQEGGRGVEGLGSEYGLSSMVACREHHAPQLAQGYFRK